MTAAQNQSYDPEDLEGGTITVTNLGPFDIETFDPLLNPPQVATLGVGAVQEQSGEQLLPLSLTFDHRAVDGADAARFLDALAEALEHPLWLINPDMTGEPHPIDTTDDDKMSNDVSTSRDNLNTIDDTVIACSEAGMTATISARAFQWTADEPIDRGGTDNAPTPVEQFLGSLSSCLALTIRTVADRHDVDVETIEVTAKPHPEELSVERIDTDIDVTTDSDVETVERLITVAERACPVSNIVDQDIDRRTHTTVTQP